jgi:hypothetical protein
MALRVAATPRLADPDAQPGAVWLDLDDDYSALADDAGLRVTAVHRITERQVVIEARCRSRMARL